jgi:hypothetical protein
MLARKKKILSITSNKPIQLAVDENKNIKKFDLIVIGSGSGLDVAKDYSYSSSTL